MEIKFLNRKKFNSAIKKHVKDFTDDELIKFIRGLALKLLRGLVLRTPVDTGFARNNWQVTCGSFGGDSPFPAENNPDGTIMRELQEIEKLVKKSGLSQIIYIWNSVPYIIYLENGHSGQAPDGMVQVTFAEIASELSSRYDFVGYYEAQK